MDKIKDFLKILGKLKDIMPKWLFGILLVIVLIIIIPLAATIWFCSLDVYAERYQKPVWDYKEEQGYDIIESDIELKTANVVVTPQIVVKYDNDVIFIIDIMFYYEDNSAKLDKSEEGYMNQFRLKIEDAQKEKMDGLFQDIKKIIVEKVSDKEKVAKLEFFETKVAWIKYQNLKANREREQYMYISDSLRT